MSLLMAIRKLIPQSVINAIRTFSPQSQVSERISRYLPVTICVDIGASYFPHGQWQIFLRSPNTQWIAVEPNENNLGYLKSWGWPCTVTPCTTGLSQHGGAATLYVTHVDSGSSLLPPVIADAMTHRVEANSSYFFPVTPKTINTLSLAQLLAPLDRTAPILLKLDTQGTELSILQGAEAYFTDRRIVGIEIESTLLAEPIMQGSGKFWQTAQFLESQGFELLQLKPFPAPSRGKSTRKSGMTYAGECDSVFTLRQDVVRKLAVEYRLTLMGFYLAYQFFEEALALLESDQDLRNHLKLAGCDIDKLASFISR